ncbi:hypothetical protein QP805_04400 [Streptococcus pasteurianus]|uniref:hypothetical protein n=1 Tax=Streptococcus pasteurianus TaxID=197614 RepID=UPI002556BEB2|nr:hypothetical protein [Streptococcus pasteurianus]MDK8393947.1 hypothetical protein [Streptococcus pasteurianus]
MKKVILGSITLLSVVTLAACSSNSDTSSSTSSSTSTSQSSTTSSSTKVDNSVYDSVVKELNETLNPDNDSNCTIEIENNVADSDFPDGHNIITVLYTNEAADGMKEIIEAVDSNTAEDGQKLVLESLRQNVSDIAKKLPDDTTTISVKYKLDANQYRVVALSSKNEDIIPVTVD